MHSLTIYMLLIMLGVSTVGQSASTIRRVYETVQISQDTSLAPHRLCHDGLHLYFKNKTLCQEANIPHFNCEADHKIAPLRSSEDIAVVHGGEFITRFYHIPLEYRYQEVDYAANVVIANEMRKISMCEGREVHTTENVKSSRLVRSEGERIFVQSLLEQSKRRDDESFLLINSPVGNVDSFENLSLIDLSKSDREIESERIKSPFCSGVSQDQVWGLSGEYTGSGKRGLQPAALQIISEPLYIKRRYWVRDPETGDLEMRYEFTCNKVWEI